MQQNRYVLYTSRQPTSRAAMIRKKDKSPNQSDFLIHYGILGQKWGVRRYQNDDGTLTDAGKKRYKNEKAESENWKKSDAEHLSDEELRRRNARLQAEQQYKNLTTSEVERERNQRKKEFINKVLVGTAISLAAVAMRGHYKQAASFIGNFAKKKIAPFKAAGILKKALNSKNVPDMAKTAPEILGKHVGTINKNLLGNAGRKIYENGVYANPLLKKRVYWRGL